VRGHYDGRHNRVYFRVPGFLDEPSVEEDTIRAAVLHEVGHWADLWGRASAYGIFAGFVVFVAGLIVCAVGFGLVAERRSASGVETMIAGLLMVVALGPLTIAAWSWSAEYRADAFAADRVGASAVRTMLARALPPRKHHPPQPRQPHSAPHPNPGDVGHGVLMPHSDPVLPGLEFLTPPPAAAAEPETVPAPSPATIARYWSKVVKTPTCWWWTGAISSPDGYGRITYSTNGVPGTLSAHRFALLLTNGELPATMVCEHGCNETLCVRVDPEHAHAGTQTVNLRYAVSLGRHRGSRPGNIDPRGHYHRALAIRAALADGYDPIRLAHAREDALIATAPLFDLTLTG